MQGGKKSFTNVFSSNFKSVILKICPVMVGGTLENKSLPVFRIMDGIYPWGWWLRGFKDQVKFSFPVVEPDLG